MKSMEIRCVCINFLWIFLGVLPSFNEIRPACQGAHGRRPCTLGGLGAPLDVGASPADSSTTLVRCTSITTVSLYARLNRIHLLAILAFTCMHPQFIPCRVLSYGWTAEETGQSDDRWHDEPPGHIHEFRIMGCAKSTRYLRSMHACMHEIVSGRLHGSSALQESKLWSFPN